MLEWMLLLTIVGLLITLIWRAIDRETRRRLGRYVVYLIGAWILLLGLSLLLHP